MPILRRVEGTIVLALWPNGSSAPAVDEMSNNRSLDFAELPKQYGNSAARDDKNTWMTTSTG